MGDVMRVLRFTLLPLLALLPVAAQAQPAWDLTGISGFFAGRRPPGDGRGYQEDWFQAAQGGVVLGRYLSPHFKLEVEATATTEGTRFRSDQIAVPGSPYPFWVTSEYRTSVGSIGAVAAWQFRDNEWVHPFVEAGVSADVERTVVQIPEQFYGDPRSGGPPARVAQRRNEQHTSTRARGVMGGGAKVYFRERAFVRTDLRFTFDRDHQNLMFRAGVGFDF
jgi:hypothetical protein